MTTTTTGAMSHYSSQATDWLHRIYIYGRRFPFDEHQASTFALWGPKPVQNLSKKPSAQTQTLQLHRIPPQNRNGKILNRLPRGHDVISFARADLISSRKVPFDKHLAPMFSNLSKPVRLQLFWPRMSQKSKHPSPIENKPSFESNFITTSSRSTKRSKRKGFYIESTGGPEVAED